MTVDLSDFDIKALEVLAKHEAGGASYPSAVGHVLWEGCDPATRKRNPSPQGLALFASKFLRHLRQAGLASSYNGWSITTAGRELLAKRAAKQ